MKDRSNYGTYTSNWTYALTAKWAFILKGILFDFYRRFNLNDFLYTEETRIEPLTADNAGTTLS